MLTVKRSVVQKLRSLCLNQKCKEFRKYLTEISSAYSRINSFFSAPNTLKILILSPENVFPLKKIMKMSKCFSVRIAYITAAVTVNAGEGGDLSKLSNDYREAVYTYGEDEAENLLLKYVVKCETIEGFTNLLTTLDRGVPLTLRISGNGLNEMEINEILNGKEYDYKVNVNGVRTLNYFSLNIVLREKVGRVVAEALYTKYLKNLEEAKTVAKEISTILKPTYKLVIYLNLPSPRTMF